MYTLIRLLDPEVLISASKNICLLAFSTSAQSYTLFKNPDVFLFFVVLKKQWENGPRAQRKEMFFRGKSSLKYRSAYWDPRFKHGHTCSQLCTAIDYGQVLLFLSTCFALELSKGDPECESVSEAHYRRVRLHVVEILSDAYISVLVVWVRA